MGARCSWVPGRMASCASSSHWRLACAAHSWKGSSGISQLVRRTLPVAERIGSRGVTWVEPPLTAEVTYAELMQGWLRDPVLRTVTAS
jgi:hypothetical protein